MLYKKIYLILTGCLLIFSIHAQTPAIYSSANIFQQIKKLEVFGSVLYIAAHPDDENTRLLAYLANEKKYRTAYLSITRGDGGQNLIGDEQGIELGLIRTQELLSARRIDGAEQFFTRAYDFGYSKNPEEALRIWVHDKVLSDVVWVIRKFRPDVIISRFPTTGEGGHGHHTASAILAEEAFDAAGDNNRFPEQLKYVSVWQAKRLLWNTFNFGGNNTTREDQFKLDAGVYNPILGKSYGELAAESRSRHRSQGFGVPAQRGRSVEYFTAVKGDKPVNDLMDGVNISSERSGKNLQQSQAQIQQNYSFEYPEKNLPDLVNLYKVFETLPDSFWREIKLQELSRVIENASGLFMEAVSQKQLISAGDSIKINVVFNNRAGVSVKNAGMHYGDLFHAFGADKNENNVYSFSQFIPKNTMPSQPYRLEYPLTGGSFDVRDQAKIGKPENDPMFVDFSVIIEDKKFVFRKPVLYKFTDPVKGELYEPVQIVSPAFINVSPSLVIFANDKKRERKSVEYTIQSNIALHEKVKFYSSAGSDRKIIYDSLLIIPKTGNYTIKTFLNGNDYKTNSAVTENGELEAASLYEHQYTSLKKISYDHIPDIFYNYRDGIKILKMDLKIAGRTAGYIAGAGDKVPEALEQMGYLVTMLEEKDITAGMLKRFDVIITGVRAYNVHAWLSNVHPLLMQYVKEGGVLLTQYNTNNSIGPVKANISPYPFVISRNRITDETAAVNFLLPEHPALNYPNKITQKDFEGWIQERSIYHAEKTDSAYKKILSMKDPGEQPHDGSLIIADYGKGRYVYTGLAFFRELPAGVPGAFRLFANLLARRNEK